jgi:hypothetical protein
VTTPSTTPRLTRDALLARVAAAGYATKLSGHPLYLVGIRGYYRDSMGAVGRNDIGIYDDAIFVISPNVFAAFNANTDPSVTRPGIATLVPGLWMAHKIGLHKGYRALSQQMGEVTVARAGGGLDTGWFGINIHRGSVNSTSSEGCQTIPPPQWPGFIGLVESEARRCNGPKWNTRVIPYALLEESA